MLGLGEPGIGFSCFFGYRTILQSASQGRIAVEQADSSNFKVPILSYNITIWSQVVKTFIILLHVILPAVVYL